MRKWLVMGSMLVMVVLAAGCGKRISMDEAKTIVLSDAGVTAGEVVFTREQQDEAEFEFRFQTEREKFEYEVGRNGKIESKLREQHLEEDIQTEITNRTTEEKERFDAVRED